VIAPSTIVKALQYLAWLFYVCSLLDEQIDILLAAASGSDVLALLPTGFGKTISFWALPFFFDFVFNGDPRDEVNRVLSSDSTFIKPILVVISPLNNLMQEHCAVLGQLKTALKATFLSSNQNEDAYVDVARGLYQILYLSPERAAKELHALFSSSLFRQRVVAVAVDEAHCILVWGNKFREQYGELFRLRVLLGSNIPFIFLTATLTMAERTTILSCFGSKRPVVVERPANRPNFFYEVTDWYPDRCYSLVQTSLVNQPDSAPRRLVFTRTKEEGTAISLAIADRIGQLDGKTQARRVLHLHADLAEREKAFILADFLRADSECRVLIASVIFSMGTDPKCLYHVDVIGQPVDLSILYQQFGRPGRDGKASRATLHIKRGRQYGTKLNMKVFMQRTNCLRMLFVQHFNSSFSVSDVWPVLPGSSDSEKSASCCSVCAERGTLHDDVEKDIEVDEDEKDEDGNEVLLDDEKAYAYAANQYYEDGYVYNPATL